MENQMTNLKCRKCGAIVNAEQKKCPKCGAPILLKVMQEEEKRHLPAKEIREKDKRMRREYAKINKEKEIKRQKTEKKQQLAEEKKEKAQQKAREELELLRKKEEEKAAKAEIKKAKREEKQEVKESKKKFPLWAAILAAVAVIAIAAACVILVNRPKDVAPPDETEIETTVETEEITEEIPEAAEEEPAEEAEPVEEVQPEPAPEEPPKQPEVEKKPVRNITRNNYLFPSDTKYLTESDVNGLSKFDTGLIRNEIFARKGYVFKNDPYKSYFNSQAWYNPNPSAKMKLNEIEKYNVNFLLEYERSQGWR